METSFRTYFRERFAAFLRENFRTPEHVAVCFGVTGRCAQYWWDGVTAPNGAAVAYALTHPDLAPSAARHIGGGA